MANDPPFDLAPKNPLTQETRKERDRMLIYCAVAALSSIFKIRSNIISIYNFEIEIDSDIFHVIVAIAGVYFMVLFVVHAACDVRSAHENDAWTKFRLIRPRTKQDLAFFVSFLLMLGVTAIICYIKFGVDINGFYFYILASMVMMLGFFSMFALEIIAPIMISYIFVAMAFNQDFAQMVYLFLKSFKRY